MSTRHLAVSIVVDSSKRRYQQLGGGINSLKFVLVLALEVHVHVYHDVLSQFRFMIQLDVVYCCHKYHLGLQYI